MVWIVDSRLRDCLGYLDCPPSVSGMSPCYRLAIVLLSWGVVTLDVAVIAFDGSPKYEGVGRVHCNAAIRVGTRFVIQQLAVAGMLLILSVVRWLFCYIFGPSSP